jgi:hypothetical protein
MVIYCIFYSFEGMNMAFTHPRSCNPDKSLIRLQIRNGAAAAIAHSFAEPFDELIDKLVQTSLYRDSTFNSFRDR